MINKRLLIKNLLAHSDESSFYDKKRQLNLHTKEGKAKFLKHICALSNSNPHNNSYIIVGVEDKDNEIVGVDFFDDSRIQNLVNAYLENPPKILYENVPFPNLPKEKVVGLVSIKPNNKVSYFRKNIYSIQAKTTFLRQGSNSIPLDYNLSKLEVNPQNTSNVTDIENSSRNSIKYTLDGVIDFINNRHKDFPSKYNVFKELFVICWAGIPFKIRNTVYFSRVDIELINEQVKLFYSALDVVTISYNNDSFTIIEHIPLGLNDKTSFYPFEQVNIRFFDNGYYKMETQILFEPPHYNKKMLKYIYSNNLILISKLNNGVKLSEREEKDLENLPSTLMICYFNGFHEAKQKLIETKESLKKIENPLVYLNFKEVMRILRKLKYGTTNE